MSTPFKMFLPRYRRRSPDFTMRWDDIQHEVDLPRRLFVGDLCEGSFQRTAEGWAADYKDGPFTACIEKRGDSMWFSESFNGVQRGMFVFPSSVEGSQCVNGYFRNNGLYDDVLKELFSDLNLTYLPYQSEKTVGISCSFPDATFSSVVVPLPFSKETFEGVRVAVHDLEQAKIPSTGLLKSSRSVVNYLEGKCPMVPTSEFEHLDWMMLRGFLPTDTPVWEGQASNRAYTSRRISPVLFLTVAQSYLPRTIRILADHELLVSKASAKKDQMAFVLHTADATCAKSVSNFTSDKSRRIFLPLFDEGDKAVNELLGTPNDSPITPRELARLLNTVMEDFEKSRDDLVGEMVKLMSNRGGE